ncbi:MAG: hypothetical protein ACD_52C00008G0002 [uncultured bacterium]|nr:MAG: hypothetical protein ACD_52C00008G0002 [uncultured bacterium]
MPNDCETGGAAHWAGGGPVTIIGGNIERADISASTPEPQSSPATPEPSSGSQDIGTQQEQMGRPKGIGTI